MVNHKLCVFVDKSYYLIQSLERLGALVLMETSIKIQLQKKRRKVLLTLKSVFFAVVIYKGFVSYIEGFVWDVARLSFSFVGYLIIVFVSWCLKKNILLYLRCLYQVLLVLERHMGHIIGTQLVACLVYIGWKLISFFTRHLLGANFSLTD